MNDSISISRAARAIGIRRQNAYRLLRSGKLQAVPGTKPLRVTAESLRRVLEERSDATASALLRIDRALEVLP